MALCPTNASSVQRVRVSPRRRLFQNLLKFSEPFFPGALCNSPLVRHLVASRKRSSVCLQQHRTYTQQWVTDQARSEKAVWACHSKSNLPVMKWLKGSFFLLFCPLLLHSLVHLALFLYLSKISCYKLGWESLLRSVLPPLPAWLSLLYPSNCEELQEETFFQNIWVLQLDVPFTEHILRQSWLPVQHAILTCTPPALCHIHVGIPVILRGTMTSRTINRVHLWPSHNSHSTPYLCPSQA